MPGSRVVEGGDWAAMSWLAAAATRQEGSQVVSGRGVECSDEQLRSRQRQGGLV